MRDLPNKVLAAVSVVLVIGLSAANAQDASAPPRGLTPAETGAEPGPDVVSPALPASQGTQPAPSPLPSGPTTLEPKAGMPAGSGVEMQSLTAPDPSGVGLLRPGNGGFGPQTWAGLGLADASALLAALPAANKSPVMRDLNCRFLLSASAGIAQRPADGTPSLLALRVQKLMSAGLLTEAVDLAKLAPAQDTGVQELIADAFLLAGRDAEACETVARLKAVEGTGDQLRRGVYCQIAAGNPLGAQLSLEVFREKRIEDNPFISTAQALIDNTPAKAVGPGEYSAAHLALFRRAKVPLPGALAEGPPLSLVRALAVENTFGGVNLGAAMRAAAFGALPLPDAIARSTAASFKPDQIDDPEEASLKVSTGEGDAMHLAALGSRRVPAAQSAAFAALLGRAERRGEFPFAAMLLRDAATAMPVIPETAWAAPLVTRVLFYNGLTDRAEQWQKQLSFGSPSDQPVLNAIHIYSWLISSTPDRAQRGQSALRWLAETAGKPGSGQAAAKRRLTREIPIIAAMGLIVPPEAQFAVTSDSAGLLPTPESLSRLDAMERAAAQGHVGATAANAVAALNGESAGQVQSQIVARIMAALSRVGLRKEAKALGIEAILAQGR